MDTAASSESVAAAATPTDPPASLPKLKTARKIKQRSYRHRKTDDDDDDNEDVVNEFDEPVAKNTPATSTDTIADADDNDGLSLQDALELRKLRKRNAGISATRLGKGASHRRPGAGKRGVDADDADHDDDEPSNDNDPWKLKSGGGLINIKDVRGRTFGGDGSKAAGSSGSASMGSGGGTGSGSFEVASTAMDADKHMKAYVEAELRRRHGTDSPTPTSLEEDESESRHDHPTRPYDFEEQLFEIPESLQLPKRHVEEDNVTLSAGMLTTIPEVDLGISNRISNIEMTERAKRDLLDQNGRPVRKVAVGEDGVVGDALRLTRFMPAERFWGAGVGAPFRGRGHHHGGTRGYGHGNRDGIRDGYGRGDGGAGNNNNNGWSNQGPDSNRDGRGGHHGGGGDRSFNRNNRHGMATDMITIDRFRKRMRR